MNLPAFFLHLPSLLAQADTPVDSPASTPLPDVTPSFTPSLPSTGGLMAGGVAGLIPLLIALVVLIGMWKVFTKAGKPGWAVLIPIYNLIVLLEIAGRPLWWFILLIIPFVNLIVLIIVCIDIAKHFGQGTGFGLGLAFLGFIFFPILGFGSARYLGAGGAPGGYPNATM